MKKNVGRTDQVVRIILGILIMAAGIIFKSWLGLFGIIPVITALTKTCGVYLPFGIDTRKKDDD